MPDSKPQHPALRALSAAFPHTLPILAGFAFLGFAYGLYMSALGFSFLYPTLMALCIYGGSLEFVAAEMLLGSFAPLSALLASLMIQARHLFYGIAMLEKFKGTSRKKPYLIFGMCDETFSINYSAVIGRGPRLVHVLRHAAEPKLLGAQRHARRHRRGRDPLQHRGA